MGRHACAGPGWLGSLFGFQVPLLALPASTGSDLPCIHYLTPVKPPPSGLPRFRRSTPTPAPRFRRSEFFFDLARETVPHPMDKDAGPHADHRQQGRELPG